MKTSTLDYYAQTKPAIPKQLGALTLFEAAELSDAVSCIRTVCQHVYQSAGHEVPERHAARLAHFNGRTLSLAKAKSIITLWIKWTGRGAYESAPGLVTVESFLFNLRELYLS